MMSVTIWVFKQGRVKWSSSAARMGVKREPVAKLKERVDQEDLERGGRIIVKQILKRQDGSVGIELIRRQGQVVGCCEHGNEHLMSIKCWKFHDWMRNCYRPSKVGWLVRWEGVSVGQIVFLFVVKFCMPVVMKQWAYNGEVIDSGLFLTVNSVIGVLQIKGQTVPYASCFQRQTLCCQHKPH